jgi:hypothetical protein
MSATYGYDNLYNESVNDIALLNYNKGIANRLRLQEQQMQNKLPFKEPQMLTGGVRASNSIIAGTSVDAVPRAVGGRAYRKFTGEETPAEGGKINRLKKAKRFEGFAKDTIEDALGLYKKATGGVNRLKKAKRFEGFAKDTIEDALGLYKKATGGVNRLKKAKRFEGFAKDTIEDALGLYKKATGGMVYSPDLQKALEGCGECSGGAKKRSGRFAKGSAEAKDFMASIRAKKIKK